MLNVYMTSIKSGGFFIFKKGRSVSIRIDGQKCSQRANTFPKMEAAAKRPLSFPLRLSSGKRVRKKYSRCKKSNVLLEGKSSQQGREARGYLTDLDLKGRKGKKLQRVS